jgi:putative DNA primase/helicase
MSAPHSLAAIAKALGGEVSGKSVLAPGPGHSAKDRSLSVKPSVIDQDGLIVHSHAGDDWRQCREHVRARLGLSGFRPRRELKRRIINPSDDGAERKRELALRIWREAINPCETLVEAYLKSRGLNLPEEAAHEAIRFHPYCQVGHDRFPAMVCQVRNIATNEPQAIHRTALAPDGTSIKRNGKTHRMGLGPITGGAIKIDPDEDVTQGLCIGEGVETCLAGRLMGLRPVWSVVNTRGIETFPVLPGLDGLHIIRENDANGASAKAVEACARGWHEAGRDVVIADPDTAKDLNDELREQSL